MKIYTVSQLKDRNYTELELVWGAAENHTIISNMEELKSLALEKMVSMAEDLDADAIVDFKFQIVVAAKDKDITATGTAIKFK